MGAPPAPAPRARRSSSTGARAASTASTPAPEKARVRSIAHRYAAVLPTDLNDLYVVGVRYDDDEPDVGDSVLARQRPGRLEPIARFSGVVRALARTRAGVVVLVGDEVKDVSGAVLRGGVKDLAMVAGSALALCGDDVIDLDTGATVRRAKDAVSVRGGLVRTAHGVVGLDGNVIVEGAVDACAALDVGPAYARGKELVVGARRYPMPWPIQTIAASHGRIFVGSKGGGLGVVDDDEGRVLPLRPSLRAHQLAPTAGGLVVVADLFLATSDDGQDFLTRDLAPIVRLAEAG